MKETERILKPVGISLARSIEILGKVGQGEMVLGKMRLPINSELSQEASTILNQIIGH